MLGRHVNRVSGLLLLILSAIALVTVITGYFQPPQRDEGTGAHIFQLSIVALVPTIVVFIATADWKTPLRSGRPLMSMAAMLLAAFGALYYLERYLYAGQFR